VNSVLAALVPPGVVTKTLVVPAVPAGVVQQPNPNPQFNFTRQKEQPVDFEKRKSLAR
jgi:hypothetical protein